MINLIRDITPISRSTTALSIFDKAIAGADYLCLVGGRSSLTLLSSTEGINNNGYAQLSPVKPFLCPPVVQPFGVAVNYGVLAP